MEPENATQIYKIFLLGISENSTLQPFLFGLFLFMYLVTVLGNLVIILLTVSDSHLHIPMYFFLSSLSFADIGFTSTSIPKMLVNIQIHSKVITYEGCIIQVYFFTLFGVLDSLLLTVMAYDCFLDICHPLHYMVIMNLRVCGLLVLVSWVTAALYSLLGSLMTLSLSFCTDLEIQQFLCEINELIQLACSNTFANDIVMYFAVVLLGGGPFAGILYSYAKIDSSISAISSAQGRYKAFSTCTSHISVVSLFYFTILGVYRSSSVSQNTQSTARASVMYSIITHMLNPFIYSLRNKDIMGALRRLSRGKP
ncbi:olfactory receptor 19-like [Heterocephalus glaber]|uniref:Olfactory receptor 19-like n=1 Tax=Heterocephalus glaber TaxID=10181 RepID=A0AAX6QGD1_HETGA|nr:olfactory receptor 19-like [Heterocephalus glaber]